MDEIILNSRKVQVGSRQIKIVEVTELDLEFEKFIKWLFLGFGILLGCVGVLVYLSISIESCVARVF